MTRLAQRPVGTWLAFVVALAVTAPGALPARGQEPPRLTFDQSMSVYNRRVQPPEPAESVDWEGRIGGLLREQPGDVIVTAVGDMIFNEQISRLPDPVHRQLFRLMQEADIAYGNLEFSMNAHPELQRPFYNFRADPEFAWELAAIGINMVSMSNNHALDFGPEGLRDCLRALDRANITYAGAGMTLAAARAPGSTGVQSRTTRFGLLSYMRYWTQKYRCTDPGSACLATIDPAEILVAGEGGKVEKVEGLLEKDVVAMEDDVVLAARHHDVVMVALHNHDRSHHRAYGIQDTTPANDEIMYRRAVDAGADVVLGSGPHVLRGIEIYKGKPIFYSLSNFIYQYRTPDRIPVDLIHQRDGEIARPTNVSVWDRRDPRRVFEGVMVRLTINEEKVRRIELIPFSIDDEGPLYGVPRLASSARAKEIIEVLRRLSGPYGTTIVDKGWYAEVALKE
ncbi:MAG: CapA family protein [Acidobacteriota bacterium]